MGFTFAAKLWARLRHDPALRLLSFTQVARLDIPGKRTMLTWLVWTSVQLTGQGRSS